MKPNTKVKLPIEVQQDILRFLPRKTLSTAMRVNKSFYQTGRKLLYRHIRFYSVLQRDKFFELLSLSSNSVASPTSSTIMSPEISSPGEAPAVRIPRRRSPRINRPSDLANLIYSLDFGLRPREMSKREPQLPCTRVKTSPIRAGPSISDSPVGEPPNRSGVVSRMSDNLSQRRSNTPVLNLKTETYGEWNDRFVSTLMPKLAELLPNLVQLNLCGTHLSKNDFTIVLSGLTNLEWLDVSYSTLKSDSVSLISRFCRTKLQFLNLSGIFKFGRNKGSLVVDMTMYCEALSKIVLIDCPEFYGEHLEECEQLCAGRIEFITDEGQKYD